MATGSRYTMRALTQRNTAAANAYGEKTPATWTTLVASQRCRVWVSDERTREGDAGRVPIEDLRGAVPLGTDLTERDRFGSVSNRRGTQLFGALLIDGVMRRVDHLELRLRRASSDGAT